MLEYKSHKSGRFGLLVFQGRLDENCYKSLESLLMMALISEESVVLDFTDVTSVNLECMKLLCTSHRTASALNKRLIVRGAKKEIFASALKDPRYSRHVHCVLGENGRCYFENELFREPMNIPGEKSAGRQQKENRINT